MPCCRCLFLGHSLRSHGVGLALGCLPDVCVGCAVPLVSRFIFVAFSFLSHLRYISASGVGTIVSPVSRISSTSHTFPALIVFQGFSCPSSSPHLLLFFVRSAMHACLRCVWTDRVLSPLVECVLFGLIDRSSCVCFNFSLFMSSSCCSIGRELFPLFCVSPAAPHLLVVPTEVLLLRPR